MNVYLDSSAVIAGLVRCHEHHAVAAPWLSAARAGHVKAMANLHVSAETWRTLTSHALEKALSMRGAAKITNDEARLLVLDLFEYISFVPPSSDQYQRAIERCSTQGYRSSVIYDALHLIAAEGGGVDAVVTLNERDFQRLTQLGSPRILSPMVEQPPPSP
jgi:predicted nucleic acid-binding protein